jgi:hypothetical protein
MVILLFWSMKPYQSGFHQKESTEKLKRPNSAVSQDSWLKLREEFSHLLPPPAASVAIGGCDFTPSWWIL